MWLDKKFASVYASCPGVDFDYDRQKPLFKNVDFGIDMESRSECVPLKFHHQHLKYTRGPNGGAFEGPLFQTLADNGSTYSVY